MKQSKDWLKEACAQLAQEEADQMIRELDQETLNQAEALFKRHRKTIFAMLSQNKRKKSSVAWLRAAACLILVAGGVWLALSHQTPDTVPLAPVYTASVAPYFSPAPTVSPAPTQTIAPTPIPTPLPTNSPIPTNTPSPIPTYTPIPTNTPSSAPTYTPLPTQTPYIFTVPDGWSGQYFPEFSSAYQLNALEQGDAYLRASYQDAASSALVIFEEHSQATAIAVPPAAQVSYVQVNEYVALQMIQGEEITLCWEAEGRTLVLTAPANEALALARSVKIISQK